MMNNNYFLNNANRAIGENARFLRDFMAGQAEVPQTAQSPTSDPLTSMIQPMLLLMMFQLMQRIMAGGNAGGAGMGSIDMGGYVLPDLAPQAQTPPPASMPGVQYLTQLFQTDPADAAAEADYSDEDRDAVLQTLADGGLSHSQLGSALKYWVAEGPENTLGAATFLLTDLFDAGEMLPGPFLQDGYLAVLPAERRHVLMSAVMGAGLRLEDETPNTRLAALLLEYVNRDEQPATRDFVRQFLQASYNANKSNPDTLEAQTLSDILALADVAADETGQLVFS